MLGETFAVYCENGLVSSGMDTIKEAVAELVDHRALVGDGAPMCVISEQTGEVVFVEPQEYQSV